VRRVRASRPQFKLVHERINEPNRIVGADIIFHRLRQQQNLRPIESRNVRHVQFYRAGSRTGIVSRLQTSFSHGLQEIRTSAETPRK
jgi:hypothetical protein